MMKRKEKPVDILRTYLHRNNKEQEIPDGYISKVELKHMLGISENQFARIIRELVRRNDIERIDIKRLKNGRIYKMPFFKMSSKIVKMLASR